MTTITIDEALALFFREPQMPPVIPSTMSVLYLLRRDIAHCIDNSIALFPATMALFAGVDLLAKFHAGSDETGQVGPRFRNFITMYFSGLSTDDADILYQLRNALLHSFGLYSKTRTREFSFNIAPASNLIEKVGNSVYVINPWILRVRFDEAIQQYHAHVSTDSGLRANFQKMFPIYGTIIVGNMPVP